MTKHVESASASKNEPPTAIAVVGMHRAGTSMVAKALRLGGVHLGEESELVSPAPDNPEGFFEHAAFVEIDDDLLEATGGAWDQPPECPPLAADDPRVADQADRAARLVAGLTRSPAWGWKDPRASLLTSFWLDIVPDLRFIVCLRNPLEVTLSLKRRNKSSYAHALHLWRFYYSAVLENVPAERRLVTHFQQHFDEPEAEIQRLFEFAELGTGAAERAARARDESLRHHRVDVSLAAAGVDSTTAELYAQLCEGAGVPELAEPLATSHEPARIDRRALDLHTTRVESERRGRQVESLRRERERMEERLTSLERALEPTDGAGAVVAGRPAIEVLEQRVAELERARFENRLTALERNGRKDVPVLRGCAALLHEHVPPGAAVMVVAKDDPVWLKIGPWEVTSFPADASGRYLGFPFSHGVAAIAHLEARRWSGAQFLLLPETFGWWRDHYPSFVAHLGEAYVPLADEPAAGMLVDLRERRKHGDLPGTVPELIDRLAATDSVAPSILDWTGRGVADLLPEQTVFPPPEGEELPYLDRTVDVVLLAGEDGGARRAQAQRVAAAAVVDLASHGTVIEHVEFVREPPPAPGTVRFLAHAEGHASWLRALTEIVEAEPGAELLTIVDATWGDLSGDAEVLALVEPGVLPLRGACDAVRRTLGSISGCGAVAVKLLTPRGQLEAAGTTVYSDGSVAGTAAGTFEVAAPWHEFVRPSCGSAGILFLDPDVVADGPPAAERPRERSLTAWSGLVWSTGRNATYQPDAAAVRIGEVPEVAERGVSELWAPALPSRPSRPEVMDERTWRELIAADEIASAWEPRVPSR